MKMPFQFDPARLSFSAADLADLPSADSILKRMESDLAAQFGTSPDLVRMVGTSTECNALYAQFVIHCERCGNVQKEPVCEHCMKAIKPTTTVEQWKGLEIHSTVRDEGTKIWIDEFAYDPKAK